MAFNIVLYYSYSDPKTVGKELVEGPTISCRPTESVDILNPSFVIDYNESYLNYNYLYCPLFQRYYFINDKVIDIGKKIVFNCNVDVLESFKIGILRSSGTITRASSLSAPTDIPDEKFPVNPNIKEMLSMTFQGGDPLYQATRNGGTIVQIAAPNITIN